MVAAAKQEPGGHTINDQPMGASMDNTTDLPASTLRVCEYCGKPYAEPDATDIDRSIWEPPVGFRVGVSRSCLSCWLGVTDLIERDEGNEEP